MCVYFDVQATRSGTAHRQLNVRILALALGVLIGSGCGGDSTPSAPVASGRSPVATLTPSMSGFGPAEAGKRARDRIALTVRDGLGEPLAGAGWRWNADEQAGWVYPSEGVTAGDGRIAGTWVPGSPGRGVLTLSVDAGSSALVREYRTESVAPPLPPRSAVTVWMDHEDRADGYSIDLTPLTEPGGTYYAAMNWDGGYAGLQRAGSRFDRQLQFSVWDSPGAGDARVIERGEGVQCREFGGEGTGQACELNYPWSVGGTYRFELTETRLNGASALTLHVTALTSGERRFVGTLRYAEVAELRRFAMFVEDFWNRARHCLAQPVRGAAIRRAMMRVDGAWRPIRTGLVSRHREDAGNPGTPPCANLAVRERAAGLEVVMGGRTASDPDASARVGIPE